MIFCDVTGINSPTSGSLCHEAPHARDGLFRRQAPRDSGWERSRAVKTAAANLANASFRKERWVVDTGIACEADAIIRPKNRPTVATKTINLALQGGGAHGAFTWGVLDRLLEDQRIEIEGISATSAGSMNRPSSPTASRPEVAMEPEPRWPRSGDASALQQRLRR
jgi:hypothetical protein